MPEDPSLDLEALLSEQGWLRHVALRLVHDPHAADDLTQETMLRALDKGRLPARRRGWLRTVLARLAIDRQRSNARRERRERQVAPFEDGDSEALGRAALRRDIVEEVLRLGEPERSAVTLRYLEDLSFAEVARRLGLTETAARKRVSRGIAELRGRLDSRPGGRSAWLAIAAPWVGTPTLTLNTALPTTLPLIAMKTQANVAIAAAFLLIGSAALLLWNGGAGAHDMGSDPARRAELTEVRGADGALPEVQLPISEREASSTESETPLVASTSLPAFPKRSAALMGSLELRVTWHDGTPAAGVTAKLLPWGDNEPRVRTRSITTDGDGRACAEQLAPGRLGVYMDRAEGGGSYDIEPGSVTVAELEVPEGFEVAGRVLDPQGNAVAHATIVLSDYGNDSQGKPVARSDAKGRFVLRDLGPGRSLSARANGFSPSLYVDLADMARGERYTVDLKLREGGATLRGVVQTDSGVALRGALLRIEPAAGRGENGSTNRKPHPIELRSAEDGSFEVHDLGSGSVLLMARTAGHVPYQQRLRLEAGGTEDVVIAMRQGGQIAGIVRRMGGEPAVGATVRVGDSRSSYGFLGRRLTVDARGHFELAGVEAGRVQLAASEPDYGQASADVAVRVGQATQVELALVAGATVTGLVLDERGAPLGNWMVGTLTGTNLWDRRTTTAADGTFTLRDLRPDAKRIHTMPDGAWEVGPVASAPIEGGPVTLRVRDAQRPTCGLSLRVLTEGRAPKEAVAVSLRSPGGGYRQVFTDKSGSLSLGSLGSGVTAVEIRLEGWAQAKRSVELIPGETADLGVIELARGGRVKVALTSDEGLQLPSQATLLRPDGSLEAFFDLDGGVGLSEPVEPGDYRLQINGRARLASSEWVKVLEGETIALEMGLLPAAFGWVSLKTGAQGEITSTVRYTVSAGGEERRFTSRPSFSGSDLPRLYLNALPPGPVTVTVDCGEGLRGEVTIQVTDVGMTAAPIEAIIELK